LQPQPTTHPTVQVELNTSAAEPIIEKIDQSITAQNIILNEIQQSITAQNIILNEIQQSITAQNIILNEIQHPTGIIENVMGIMNGVGSVA
jgi:hypothetical protein